MSPAARKTKAAPKMLAKAPAKNRGKPAGKSVKKAKPKAKPAKRPAVAARARPAKLAKAPRSKPLPPATTIGINPLDAPVSTAAVIAAVLGPAAGRRAERRTAASRR